MLSWYQIFEIRLMMSQKSRKNEDVCGRRQDTSSPFLLSVSHEPKRNRSEYSPDKCSLCSCSRLLSSLSKWAMSFCQDIMSDETSPGGGDWALIGSYEMVDIACVIRWQILWIISLNRIESGSVYMFPSSQDRSTIQSKGAFGRWPATAPELYFEKPG